MTDTSPRHHRRTLIVGVLIVAALAALIFVLGIRHVSWCDDFTTESSLTGECYEEWRWQLW